MNRRSLGHAPGTTPSVAKCDHVPRGALARGRRREPPDFGWAVFASLHLRVFSSSRSAR